MISHANFVKKEITPDPVQCGDSEEDYGELGPFSISTGEVVNILPLIRY